MILKCSRFFLKKMHLIKLMRVVKLKYPSKDPQIFKYAKHLLNQINDCCQIRISIN